MSRSPTNFGRNADSSAKSRAFRSGKKPTGKPSRFFPVVGVGASAGGLEAFQRFLNKLPEDTGMAFVLIQHLDPNHESRFREILSRATNVPVHLVTDGTLVCPNHVYVIPQDTFMFISNGTLRLTPREKSTSAPMPIDAFFTSLASDLGSLAIGIILSGTGSDGTLGLREIKAQGGVILAQDDSAKFHGMPHSAINTGDVDFILPPGKMAMELVRIHSIPKIDFVKEGHSMTTTSEEEKAVNEYSPILKLIKESTHVNFALYKQKTIIRRITRRMVLRKTETVSEYLKYLEGNPNELKALHHDLLIKVTSFFRENNTFDVLKTELFPRLMVDREVDKPLRIWVPGCSTGEEVYSLAISAIEFLGETQKKLPIQIFGTDISESAIEKARVGEYSESLMSDISEERRHRFFTKGDGTYRINRSVRELCIFAKHNVTEDPPYSGLDLISCRNLLIYLDATLQKRVISLFHYALKLSGYLMLGVSESVGASSDLFSAIDKKNKIFSKRQVVGYRHFDFARGHTLNQKTPIALSKTQDEDTTLVKMDLCREMDRVIASRFAPNGILINDALEVIQIRGRTGSFLEHTSGEISHSLLKMVRPGLLADINSAIRTAKRDNTPVRKEGIEIKHDEGFIQGRLDVIPMPGPDPSQPYYVVLFEKTVNLERPDKKQSRSLKKPSVSRIAHLEKELAQTQEYLQAFIEKEQAINEALKAANDEVLSSNEELQSMNEEMETAKEELQSTNEELHTVNDEMQNRNVELNATSNDMINLMASSRIPVLMVSRDLRVRRFTPSVGKVMKLIPSDVGRPMGDFKTDIQVPDLIALMTKVIENNITEERQVQDGEGHWFSMWIRPYQTAENKIDGAVLSLFDIDSLKRARNFSDAIVNTIRESLVVLDGDLKVKLANRCFYETFHVAPEETEGRSIYSLGKGQWDIADLHHLLEKVLPEKTNFQNYEADHYFPDIGQRTMLLNASKIKDGGEQLILLAIDDVTEIKRGQSSLLNKTHDLEEANRELEQFAYIASHDLQEPLRNVAAYMQLLSKRYKGKVLDKNAEEYIEIALTGAMRMKMLVEDLLSFSKAGRESLTLEPTDCSVVIDKVLESLRPLIDESHAEIIYESLPTIMAESVLLGQVFQNLISNAIKFRGASPPRIEISVKEKDNTWEFAVKDNGIGIDKQYTSRIFLIFQRLHSKESYPGTGIGLAMCKKIVDRYGGRIWLGSELGKGSTFFFTLPLKQMAT